MLTEYEANPDPMAATFTSNLGAISLYEAPTSNPIGLNFEKILK